MVTPSRMLAWADEAEGRSRHDSGKPHRLVWADVLWLPEGEDPFSLVNPVRLPWLDETEEAYQERLAGLPQTEGPK